MIKNLADRYETALTDWAEGEITDARRELKALRGEIERLVRVISQSPVVIYRADPARGCVTTFISENVRDVLGYAPEEVLADPDFWTRRTHPDDLEAGRAFTAAADADECVSREYRVRRKDGTWAWVQDRNCLADGSCGGPQEIIGSLADVTEARGEREHLLERSRLFKTIFHYAPSGISTCGPDGIFTEANEKWLEIFAARRADLRGKTPMHFIHGEGLARCTAMQERILAGAMESFRTEERFLRMDGALFWGDIVSRAVLDAEGRVQGMICILNDVTERKMTLEALARSEGKFRGIVESSPMGVHLLHRNENGVLELAAANPAADRILGITHADALGKPLARIFPELESTGVVDSFLKVIATGESWHPGYLQSQDGSVPGMIEAHAFRVDPRTCCCMFINVTERIQAEEALRQSEQEKKAILDTIAESVTFLDQDHVIRWANRAAAVLSGLDAEELVGRACHSLWGRCGENCRDCPVPVCLEEHRAAEGESASEDGRVFRVHAYPFHLTMEGPPGALVVSRDVTEQRRNEEEARKARELAENATKMKDEFLANMSHELRSPLNGMLGMLDVLMDTKLDDEQRDSIEIALSAGEGLLAIINDILDFSKLQADKITLSRNEFDLRQTLRTVVNTFGEQSARTNLDVSWSVAPEVPEKLVGDEGRIRQILFNLVGNAIKFTKEGSVRVGVDILCKTAHPGQARLLFTVEDTGIGIPEDQLETIFDPFVQLNWAKSHKYEGTGLGLGIVKRLVTLMGGIITVESEVGTGTTVNFWINVQAP